MFYRNQEKRLVEIFKKNGFEEAYSKGFKKYLPIKNNYNFDIRIEYPGYKTKITSEKIVYDYKVEYNHIAISHVNIIIDLYNKIIQAPQLYKVYECFLKDIAKCGWEIDFSKYKKLEHVKLKCPSCELLNYVENLHNKLDKPFKREGNEGKCYSIYELAYFITLIVMQEDINYPMPYYEGRRMSFYRYIEAVNRCSLESVIKKTLTHGRSSLIEGINYKEIIELDQSVR